MDLKEYNIKISKKFIFDDFDLTNKEIATLVSISSFVNESISTDEMLITEPISIYSIMGRLKIFRDKQKRNSSLILSAVHKMLAMELISRVKYHDDTFRYFIHLPKDVLNLGNVVEIPNSKFEKILDNSKTFSKSASLLSCFISISSQCFEHGIDEDGEVIYDGEYFEKIKNSICQDSIKRIGMRYDMTEKTTMNHIQELIEGKYIYGAMARTAYNQNGYYFTTTNFKNHLGRFVENDLKKGKVVRYVILSKNCKIKPNF